jgi:hypothetical protein
MLLQRRVPCCSAHGEEGDDHARSALYNPSMERFLPVLIVLAMLATLAVLGLGLLSMARGDSAKRSNKLMQSRVLLQGIALLLFLVFMWLFRR